MESILKSELPHYYILEGTVPTLQVILAPGQSLRTDLNFISYLSKSLSIKARSKFLCGQSYPLPYRVKNKTGGLEYIGLASASKQHLLAVNPEVLRDDLVVQEERVLAVTNDVSIEDFSRDIYLMLRRTRWAKISNNGLVFIQSAGALVEKRLGVGEEIQVNHSCLFAYTKSVTLSKSDVQTTIGNAIFKDWMLLKCKGPGLVFIESPGVLASRRSRHGEALLMFFIFFAFSLLGGLLQAVV